MKADDEYKNYMGYMWYKHEDDCILIGITEEALEDFQEIHSLDLPEEHEKVDSDVAIGTIETDDGPLDIYSPFAGKVVEVNSSVLDDPSLIMEDPYEDGWILKIETTEDVDDEDEDEDDYDEDEEEDEEEDED